MRRRLKNISIEIITPKELEIKVNVIEDGKTAVENAIKKAQAYYEETKILTIASDSALFIDDIPSNKQLGLFVRRVNDKVLSDDEMIEYYTKLIEFIGENIKLDVNLEGETVWLSLEQMTRLFGRDKSVISRYIKNIFAE